MPVIFDIQDFTWLGKIPQESQTQNRGEKFGFYKYKDGKLYLVKPRNDKSDERYGYILCGYLASELFQLIFPELFVKYYPIKYDNVVGLVCEKKENFLSFDKEEDRQQFSKIVDHKMMASILAANLWVANPDVQPKNLGIKLEESEEVGKYEKQLFGFDYERAFDPQLLKFFSGSVSSIPSRLTRHDKIFSTIARGLDFRKTLRTLYERAGEVTLEDEVSRIFRNMAEAMGEKLWARELKAFSKHRLTKEMKEEAIQEKVLQHLRKGLEFAKAFSDILVINKEIFTKTKPLKRGQPRKLKSGYYSNSKGNKNYRVKFRRENYKKPAGYILREYLASEILQQIFPNLFVQYFPIKAGKEVGLACLKIENFRKFGLGMGGQEKKIAHILAARSFLVSDTDAYPRNFGSNGNEPIGYDYDRAFGKVSNSLLGTHAEKLGVDLKSQYFLDALDALHKGAEKIKFERIVKRAFKRMADWLQELNAFSKKSFKMEVSEKAVIGLVVKHLKKGLSKAKLFATNIKNKAEQKPAMLPLYGNKLSVRKKKSSRKQKPQPLFSNSITNAEAKQVNQQPTSLRNKTLREVFF